MSDVLDHKRLSLLIFHRIHKLLSKNEWIGDEEIRTEIQKIFAELLPFAKVELTLEKKLEIHVQNQKYEVDIRKWLDALWILYDEYYEFLNPR
ncbi:MAG: hypothetical protein NZ853_06220 [Leptospiraceae bacterium]|nr:hypothetical protein [Leptospiraceae bacterium]MDW7976453.1 hypothetical protein [Leptospiraceae bacterium]